MTEIGSTWLKMVQYGSKWFIMISNGDGVKWLKLDQIVSNWFIRAQMAQNGSSQFKLTKNA